MKLPKELEELLPMLEKALKDGNVNIFQQEEKREYLGLCPKDLYDRYYQANYKFEVAKAKCELISCQYAYQMGEKYAEVMKFEDELKELQKNHNPSRADMMRGLKLMEKMIDFKEDEESQEQSEMWAKKVVEEVPEVEEASEEKKAIWKEIKKHFGLPEETPLSIDRRGIVYKREKSTKDITPKKHDAKIKPFIRH